MAILSLLTFTVLWKGGKSLESTWLLLGVGAVCVLAQNLCRSGKWQVDSGQNDSNKELWLVVLLFIIWTGVSYLFSTTQNYGLDEVLRTAGLGFILLWYISNNQNDPLDDNTNRLPLTANRFLENKILTYITNLAVLTCTIGLLVYIFQPVNRFVGTFFDSRFHTDYWPNAAAQFLLLAWPIALLKSSSSHDDYSLEKDENMLIRLLKYLRNGIPFETPLLLTRIPHLLKPLKPILRYVPTGLALGCLLLTFSRGALIAFLGQIVLLSVLILGHGGSRKRLHKPLTHIALSLLMGFVLFVGINEMRSAFYPIQSVSEKVTFQAAEGTSSISERSSFWKHAIIMSVQKPVFGWGPYSFRFVQPRFQEHVLATSDHPHNVFLKLTAERGLIAAILFALILYAALRPGVDLALKGKRFNPNDHARLGYSLIVVSVAGVIAHNLIDYNLQFVGIALPFWLLLAILIKRTDHKQLFRVPTKLTAYRLTLTAIILSLILLTVATREAYYLATSSFGRHAEAAGNTEQALQWYAASENEWFTRDMRLSKIHLLAKSGDTEAAKASVFKYMDRNAEDARAWKLYGEIFLMEERFDEAIKNYEHAFKYGSWNDLGISSGLLEALFADTLTQPTSDAAADSKNLEMHPRIASAAPEIEKRTLEFSEAIERNMHFIALSPNPEEAIKILITLSVIFPERSGEYRTLIGRIERKVAKERSRIKARNPGWLW